MFAAPRSSRGWFCFETGMPETHERRTGHCARAGHRAAVIASIELRRPNCPGRTEASQSRRFGTAPSRRDEPFRVSRADPRMVSPDRRHKSRRARPRPQSRSRSGSRSRSRSRTRGELAAKRAAAGPNRVTHARGPPHATGAEPIAPSLSRRAYDAEPIAPSLSRRAYDALARAPPLRRHGLRRVPALREKHVAVAHFDDRAERELLVRRSV